MNTTIVSSLSNAGPLQTIAPSKVHEELRIDSQNKTVMNTDEYTSKDALIN